MTAHRRTPGRRRARRSLETVSLEANRKIVAWRLAGASPRETPGLVTALLALDREIDASRRSDRLNSHPPAGPVEALAFTVAALQSALARAASKDAPAIARQLVAAAEAWEEALVRQRTRERDTAEDAAQEKKEREIDAMEAALRQSFPERPWEWRDASWREAAEGMHEAGMLHEILMLPHLMEHREDEPEPQSEPVTVPDDYWDFIASCSGEDDENADDDLSEDEKAFPSPLAGEGVKNGPRSGKIVERF